MRLGQRRNTAYHKEKSQRTHSLPVLTKGKEVKTTDTTPPTDYTTYTACLLEFINPLHTEKFFICSSISEKVMDKTKNDENDKGAVPPAPPPPVVDSEADTQIIDYGEDEEAETQLLRVEGGDDNEAETQLLRIQEEDGDENEGVTQVIEGLDDLPFAVKSKVDAAPETQNAETDKETVDNDATYRDGDHIEVRLDEIQGGAIDDSDDDSKPNITVYVDPDEETFDFDFDDEVQIDDEEVLEEEEEDEEAPILERNEESSINVSTDTEAMETETEGQPATSAPEIKGQNGHTTSEIMTRKRAASLTNTEGPRPKLGRNSPSASSESSTEGALQDDGEHDHYCWTCHKQDVQIHCRICPRSFHTKCMQHDSPETKAEGGSCVCPECVVVMKAENVNHRSDAMQLLNMDQLSSMLRYICGRMKTTPGAEPFLKPVSQEDAEDYYEFVKYPMDIAKLETNIKNRQYGSTEAFLADVQWIVHNSVVFNSSSSPYTAAAKRLLKVVRQELSEIETCPECYTNAHTKEDWFTEACKRPHILVWAKLKGFPYWPAKAMKIKDDQVDVRFFGQHDRAWVNVKDCYLYTPEQPYAGPKKSAALTSSLEEFNQHIEKLKKAFGEVKFAEGKVVMDASLGLEQIQRLLPKYVPHEPSQLRSSTQVNPKNAASGKSPVVMTISSLKTSPTVVSNSAITDPSEQEGSSPSSSSGSDSGEDTSPENNEKDEQPQINSEELKDGDGDTKTEEGDDDNAESKEGESETKASVEISSPTTGALTLAEKEEHERRRVPSGILASALGLRRIARKPDGEETKKPETPPSLATTPTRKSLRRLSSASAEMKAEEKSNDSTDDIGEKEPIRIKPEFVQKKTSKAQDLMDQISSQAQTKPGYRFNISKDVSISAIGTETNTPSSKTMNNGSKFRRMIGRMGENVTRIAPRPNPGRLLAPGKTQSMQLQIQQMTKGLNPNQQRLMQLKNTQGMRPIRPNAPRSAGGPMVRPTVALKSDIGTTLQVASTQGQSISGAITLPGGTITVTPLTPLLAGIPVAPSISSYNTTASAVNINGAVNGLPALVPSKSGQVPQTTAVVRRTGTVTLPNTVATHMQQCSKGINDLLKTTIEQIAFDILDGGSMSGKIDAATAQKEKEGLIVKHAKEMSDLRHCHEINMRELRATIESEKRRQVIEIKRQCELEKNRAVEEAKKKQWCARCQREAQFYCCWNTSYCGYHCQEQHWPQHMTICSQNKAQAAAQDGASSPTT